MNKPIIFIFLVLHATTYSMEALDPYASFIKLAHNKSLEKISQGNFRINSDEKTKLVESYTCNKNFKFGPTFISNSRTLIAILLRRELEKFPLLHHSEFFSIINTEKLTIKNLAFPPEFQEKIMGKFLLYAENNNEFLDPIQRLAVADDGKSILAANKKGLFFLDISQENILWQKLFDPYSVDSICVFDTLSAHYGENESSEIPIYIETINFNTQEAEATISFYTKNKKDERIKNYKTIKLPEKLISSKTTSLTENTPKLETVTTDLRNLNIIENYHGTEKH